MILSPLTDDREHLYFVYRLERGAERRWGQMWFLDEPKRVERLQYEMTVIAQQKFEPFFLILAEILEWCRIQRIITGPGRGSVGGSLACYALGIHEMDSLYWNLSFSRFLNAKRVGLPDVDLDISQRDRQRVIAHIKDQYVNDEYDVLQVAAFQRAGARRTIDMVFAAKSQTDPAAGSTAEQLKKLLPTGSAITGGTKQPQEIAYWLENDGPNQQTFREIADQAGWTPLLEKLDGIQVNLAKHAAGVVIVNRADLARMPQAGMSDAKGEGWRMVTAYDMYSLDALKFLKIDLLGLRTLDIVADAHRAVGGDGGLDSLMALWELERDRNKETYELLCAADTTGVFQVETGGYRRTLKDFQPTKYDDITQLNALYRPGALDAIAEDGKRNMVQVYIDRRHDREKAIYPGELEEKLKPILDRTQGIILYQEQAMQIAQALADFSEEDADNLRKGIGKKLTGLMAQIKQDFTVGMLKERYSQHMVNHIWDQIAAASRYSWNESHARFYSVITWWTAYFKANQQVCVPELGLDGPGTAAFYCALINSLEEDKERQADAVAEARQHITIAPPDINLTWEGYTVNGDDIVFGLNGIKGIGEANRNEIILERVLSGPFQSFKDFHRRLPSVPINMKLSLIKCGAFDKLEGRERLLAKVPKPNLDKEGNTVYWTIAEFIKHNSGLKKPRPEPNVLDWKLPSEQELADGEFDTIGFYVSADPMKSITKVLAWLSPDSYWGGEIVAGSLKVKKDKNGAEMGWFTLLLTSLNKRRCMVFGSDWPTVKARVLPGARVIVQAREDGSQLIVNKIFQASDVRHFNVVELTKNGKREITEFDGQIQTLELAETSGYTVRLH